MKNRFLFEFMDLPWIPWFLRITFREALESCLGPPPRAYYTWVVNEILDIIRRTPGDFENIVELGAGSAPITRELLKTLGGRIGVTLTISDLYPDKNRYKDIERDYPGVVRTDTPSVDFSCPMDFPSRSLLVLSASFHHVPLAKRDPAIKALSSYRVAVFEPLRNNWPSFILSLLGFFAALTTPVLLWNKRSGNTRRLLWCWILPVIPLMIVWDGAISCFRCWTEDTWKDHLLPIIGNDRPVLTKTTRVSQMIAW